MSTTNEKKSLRSLDRRFGAFWVQFHKDHPWCTPTVLTLSRVLAFVPFMLCITVDFLTPLSLMSLMWIATFDIFDGVLARNANLTTRFGGFADQATDKLLILAILWTFFLLLWRNPLESSDAFYLWHNCNLMAVLVVITICDVINFGLRLQEAIRVSIVHKATLRSYWFMPYTEVSTEQRHQISSNAGKIKVWVLMIGVCFWCISWGLHLAQDSGIMQMVLGTVTSLCLAFGLWMIPEEKRFRLSPVVLMAVSELLIFVPLSTLHHRWFWYLGDMFILAGAACAVLSTSFQLRRRWQHR